MQINTQSVCYISALILILRLAYVGQVYYQTHVDL